MYPYIDFQLLVTDYTDFNKTMHTSATHYMESLIDSKTYYSSSHFNNSAKCIKFYTSLINKLNYSTLSFPPKANLLLKYRCSTCWQH